jgi:hypothetical protein
MRYRVLFLIGLVAIIVLFGCSVNRGGLSSITPTPTKTPRPLAIATLTPTGTPTSEAKPTEPPAPVETAVPPDAPSPTETLAPTVTPIPPTITPLPSTETSAPPTDTPVPPTDTPAPPTNTPKPKPTNTPVPPTNTPKPQVDFRIKEIVAFEDGSLGSTGLHNIYLTAVDSGGAPIDGVILEEVNNEPHLQVVTGDKGPGRTEFTMWAADYRFKVVGNTSGQTFTSETTHVLSILFEHAVWDDLIRGGICTDETSCRALGPMHFSYNVTFQRTW